MKRLFSVTLTVTESHEYDAIEASTPEEAETIAEQYYRDGESGTVSCTEAIIEYTEAVPVLEGTMGEIVPDMETA